MSELKSTPYAKIHKHNIFEKVYWACRRGFERIVYKFRKSEMEKWAENEVRLACMAERKSSGVPEGKWDYGCACYESALKALKVLAKEGHSGSSIRFTQDILNRLIDGKVLSPLYDTPDMWELIDEDHDEATFQCKRMSSLFKIINRDTGNAKFRDVDRVICEDIQSGSRYQQRLVRDIIDEMYPIEITDEEPYMPRSKNKYVVYCAELLTDRKNGDFDTVCVDHVVTPDGDEVQIMRFFKESGDTNNPWKEIGYMEWNERVDMQTERLKQEEYWANFNGVIELENQDISWQDLTNGISQIASAAAHVGIDLGKGDNYES